MSVKKLQEIYDSERFRKEGHRLVDMLADSIKKSISGEQEKTIHYQDPNLNLAKWDSLDQSVSTSQLYQIILDESIKIHSPRNGNSIYYTGRSSR